MRSAVLILALCLFLDVDVVAIVRMPLHKYPKPLQRHITQCGLRKCNPELGPYACPAGCKCLTHPKRKMPYFCALRGERLDGRLLGSFRHLIF
uniref:Putative secreted protein n=1 Tax=Amblyomma triste TaxID=251400 RepID=A0A023G080_AMBTT